jgi:hypothetical protein
VLWRHRYELRKLISPQNRQWKYCDCNNGNKTFGTIWTTRHFETCWRQKDTSVEKATGRRHAVLDGPPIGDDMWNCRGELPKITAYFEKRIKIGNCTGLKFGSRVNFYFCLKGKCLILSLCHKFLLLTAINCHYCSDTSRAGVMLVTYIIILWKSNILQQNIWRCWYYFRNEHFLYLLQIISIVRC